MTTISKTGIISPEDEDFYQCKLCGTIQLMHGVLQKHEHEHMTVDYVEPERRGNEYGNRAT